MLLMAMSNNGDTLAACACSKQQCSPLAPMQPVRPRMTMMIKRASRPRIKPKMPRSSLMSAAFVFQSFLLSVEFEPMSLTMKATSKSLSFEQQQKFTMQEMDYKLYTSLSLSPALNLSCALWHLLRSFEQQANEEHTRARFKLSGRRRRAKSKRFRALSLATAELRVLVAVVVVAPGPCRPATARRPPLEAHGALA